MERRTGQRLQSAAALLLLIAITIGIPAVLVRVAGWPLPRAMPDWSRVRIAIVQGDIPADTVVKALAIVVWLIWLQVVWALAWELAVNVPRMSGGRRARPAPLVAAPVGNGVGRLVALVMSIGITVLSIPAPAVALPSAPTGGAFSSGSASAPIAFVSPSRPTESASGAPRWRVDKQDSLWRIAEIALGEGDRSNEILELNSWLRSARDVRAGQVLVLPIDATVPDDRRPPLEAGPVEPTDGGSDAITYLTPTHIVIKPGDTLWDLSEDRLSIVDSDVTPRETLDQVNAVIALNPDVIEDPNLIYPGEVFEFPAVGIPPTPEVPAVDTGARTVDVGEVQDAIPPLPTTTRDEKPEKPSPAPSPAPTTTSVSLSVPLSSTSAVQDSGSDLANSDGVHGSRPVAPWVAGISGATALASGLLLIYRRRLALRAARGARAYRASTPDDPTLLSAITRAADVSLLRWANHELGELFAAMCPGDVAGMPFAVELSQTHGIEILWTAANPRAPRPWEATDGGWSWRLLYDPDLPLPEADQTAVLPALVTIGTRDGNQLLINLEAVGSLAVDADEEIADSFVRSIIVELAASELLSDAYLLCAGVPLDGAVHFDRIQRCDEAVALERLEVAVGAGDRFLQENGMTTAFDFRLGGDAAGRESTVVVVRPTETDRDHFARVARPGLGACVLIAGSTDSASSHVTIGIDGVGWLQPLGIRFEPSLLPLTTMESISDLLDEASEPFVESRDPDADQSIDVARAEGIPEVEPDEGLGEDEEWDLPHPAVLVRVLGVPEVVGYPQLGRIETSIVTYLACHGGKRSDDQIINAVWNGRLVEPKTLWNKISKIRSVLGPDLVPARLPNSPSVVLATDVVTDLSQLRELHRRAAEVAGSEALTLLIRGLEQVHGVPFDSSDYDWAYETQDHAAACETVESAALLCSAIALNLGDVPSARRGVMLGLSALPLNEPLYRERMRIESAAGNPDGVRQALAELSGALSLRSDAALDAEPEVTTVRFAEALLLSSDGRGTAEQAVLNAT